ncbi:hypothetical protein Prudu_017285 [Prunus dulcis]|uniref:Uncharacterized protein n=1 Tax=Prunus dulcis TaxID=3755 RepID=A0A4Y1RNB0_PRUDU|nr:hypothetical protein Prudu_017285 [Prunus dulcis]
MRSAIASSMAGALSALRRLYLSLYNWTVFLGWYPLQQSLFSSDHYNVLYLALKTLNESGHQHVYKAVERPLLLAQSAAVLEVWSDLRYQRHCRKLVQDCILLGESSGVFLSWLELLLRNMY